MSGRISSGILPPAMCPEGTGPWQPCIPQLGGHHLPVVLPTWVPVLGILPQQPSICRPAHLVTSCHLPAPHLCLASLPQGSLLVCTPAHLPTRYSSPERHQMLQCPMLGTGPRVFTSFSSLMTSLHSGGLVSVDQLWSRQLVNFPGISAVAITAFLMTSKPWPWEGGSPLKSVLP